MKKNTPSLKKRKPSKAFSSVFKVLALIVIISAVIASALMFGKISTENRGQAAYDPVNKCMQSCEASKFVKNKADCKADCLEVKKGEMTCREFCTENVRFAQNDNNDSITVCNKTCNSIFNPNPCAEVCQIASKSQYATKCTEQCKTVENKQKSCDQAFTSQIFPGAPADLLNFVKAACVKWFGDTTPTPSISPTATPSATPSVTPTIAPHDCDEVCSGMSGVSAQICKSVCNQFNTGKRTCPTGCDKLPSQYKQKCMTELCPTGPIN